MQNPSTENEADRRIDTVLFDYGQVLSGPPDAAAWARMRAIMGLDEEQLHAAYWAFRHDYDRAALTGRAYWHAVAERAGIAINDAQIAALMAEDVELWTDLNMPMVDWAGRLQRAGMRTGILSNIGDCIAEGIIAKLAWLGGFYTCIWSHELFMAKPEPAIFIKAAEALNTPMASILFIDDREDNVAAAAALGMLTAQYTGQAAFEHEMRARGLAGLLEVGLEGRSSGGIIGGQTPEREAEPVTK
jgi:putative hydrolase of the HAD superfamily